MLATDSFHTVVKPATLQCIPGAASHTQPLFQGFPDQIFKSTYTILQLSKISEYFYGLMESVYRAILNKFNIKNVHI